MLVFARRHTVILYVEGVNVLPTRSCSGTVMTRPSKVRCGRGCRSRLRDEILEALLVCHEPGLLRAALGEAGLADLDQKEGQYQLLRLMVRREKPLASAGLALSRVAVAWPNAGNQPTPELDTLYAMQLLDAESYRRARAHYERNFKVPA